MENFSSETAVGKSIPIVLKVYNFSAEPRTFLIKQAHPWRSWEVIGPNGKAVAFQPGESITSDETYTLKPMDSINLFGGADLAKLFDMRQAGRYTLKFNGLAVREVPQELNPKIPPEQSLGVAKDVTLELKPE